MDGGHISITISHSQIVIEDNGIGRKSAKLIDTNSTGKGLSAINEYILLFNKQLNRNISYCIDDLMDADNQAVGTRVIIDLGN